MNWGFSLLGVFDSIGETVDGAMTWLAELFFSMYNIFSTLLYNIWRLLATVVDQIEGLFRNLAGVGTGAGANDMATLIINNKAVQIIFNNLVAISTALLIFFTIFKIIQEQYKEKEGGNPYIIVFRMFKGMLMFFFVTAAVLIGLYASGVVFRALDKATGNGNVSVTGQIFQAMAYDANRLRMGPPTSDDPFARAKMSLFNKLVQSDYEVDPRGNSNKYTIAEVSGATATQSQVAAAYANLPINKWGIVNQDGKVSRINPAYDVDLPTDDPDWNKDTMLDRDFYEPGTTNQEWGVTGGFSEGSYKNDLLQAVTLDITPKIDFKYSPLEIWKTTWRLYAGAHKDTNISVMGSSVPAGYQNYDYRIESHVLQPVSENNMFSINISGGVSMQGDTAAMKFNLDMFKTSMPVDKIIATIALNYALTELVELGLSSLPEMPLKFNVAALEIDLRYLASMLLAPLVNNLMMGQLAQLVGGDSPDAVEKIKEFVSVKQGTTIPIELTKYRFDLNFMKFWQQIADSWNDFANQIMGGTEQDEAEADNSLSEIETETSYVLQQQNWAKYKGAVDTYNTEIKTQLSDFLMDCYNYANGSYGSSVEDKNLLGTSIKAGLKSLALSHSLFTKDIEKYKSMPYDAEKYLKSIYIPAFTSEWAADSISGIDAESIVNELSKSDSKLKFNVTVPTYASGLGGYQIVDWNCFGETVAGPMITSKIADQYDPKGSAKEYLSSNFDARNMMYFKNAGGGGAKSAFPYSTWTVRPGSFGASSVVSGASTSSEKTVAAQSIMPTSTPLAIDKKMNIKERVSKASNGVYGSFAESFKPLLFANGTEDSEDKDIAYGDMQYSRDVMVFRDMSNPSASNDGKSEIKALKKWIGSSSTVAFPNGDVKIFPVYSQSAETIDAIMSTNSANAKTRRYLMLADPQLGPVNEQKSQIKFESIMSYTKYGAVYALYDVGEINYFIGFAGLIVVTGVYMNFTFGLIQRIVNLGVLYMLSPLTIAFYPFDDGQRFQSQFISPFYKQTISAFAIIISLNLFFVLISPVQNAVSSATGSNWIMGTLALIAFVSMLPKIRDSITSILGADSISEKKFGDVLKDAGNSLGGAKWKNVAKYAGGVRDKMFKNKGKSEFLSRLKDSKVGKAVTGSGAFKALANSGVVKALGGNKEKRAKMQENIDAARISGKTDGLTKYEKKLMGMQDKKAEKEYNKLSDEEKGKLGIESLGSLKQKAEAGDEAAKSRLAALQEESASTGKSQEELWAEKQDKIKKDAVNSQVSRDIKDSTNRPGIFKFASGVVSAKAKAKAGIKAGKKLVGKYLKYTILDSAASALFHPITGALADTGIGKMRKYFQPSEQDKRLREMNDKEEEWRKAEDDVDGIKEKQLNLAATSLMQNDAEKEDVIRKMAAMNQASDGVSTMTEEDYKARYIAKATEAHLAKGKNEKKAASAAENEWDKKTAEEKARLFDERGGFVKYNEDLANQMNGAEIQEKYIIAARQQFEESIAKNDKESLEISRSEIRGKTEGTVTALLNNFQGKMGLKEKLPKEVYKSITEAVNNGEDVKMIARRIAKFVGGETKLGEVETHLKAINFTAEVGKAKMVHGAQSILVDGAINYLGKIEKATEWVKGDLNVDIKGRQFQDYYKAFLVMNDPRTANSMIKQEEALRKRFKGDTSSKEYQRQLNDLQEKATKAYEFARDAVGKDKVIRARDYSVRQLEREDAEYVNMMGKQYRNRIDYHLKTNMSSKAQTIMNTDTAIRDLKAKGDYTGAALKMDRAIEAAMKQDWQELESSGLDAETVDQFKKWGQSQTSGHGELKSIRDFYAIGRQFLGNAKGPSGGRSIQATRNQMAAMFQVIENKEISEFYSRQIDNLGKSEESLRRKLAVTMESIKDKFSADSKTWGTVAGVLNLTDLDGNPVKDIGLFASDLINRVATGQLTKDHPKYKEVVTKIKNLSADWATNTKVSGLMAGNRASPLLDSITESLTEASQAALQSDEQDTLNMMKAAILKDGYLTYIKLEADGGGDSKKKGG